MEPPGGGWGRKELDAIGRSEEIDIAPRRADGKQVRGVPVWVVRHGERLFIRSAVKGRAAAWYRAVEQSHSGQVVAGRMRREVRFLDADHSVDDALDAEYRTKYGQYGSIVDGCVTAEARATTVELVPAN